MRKAPRAPAPSRQLGAFLEAWHLGCEGDASGFSIYPFTKDLLHTCCTPWCVLSSGEQWGAMTTVHAL